MASVSVIMSTYNSDENYLKNAIESILNQSYKDFEFIIVIDGSSNDDEKIIKSYNDSRIKIINNKVNLGLAESINRAINVSRGKYIARMDSDDISFFYRLEKQVQYLEKNNDIDILGTFAKYIGESKKASLTPLNSNKEIHVSLLFGQVLLHPTVMIRKKFLIENDLKYNPEFVFAQDFDMWTRCADVGNMKIYPEILLFLRKHSKQISTEKNEYQRDYAEKIIKKQLDKFGITYDNQEFNMHLMLTGLKKIEINNLTDISNWINKIASHNETADLYDQAIVYKVFCNRLFNIYFKLPISKIYLLIIALKTNKFRRQIFNSFNLRMLVNRIRHLIKANCQLLIYKYKERKHLIGG